MGSMAPNLRSFRVGGYFGTSQKVWKFPTLKAITLELSTGSLSMMRDGSKLRVFGLEDMAFCWLSLFFSHAVCVKQVTKFSLLNPPLPSTISSSYVLSLHGTRLYSEGSPKYDNKLNSHRYAGAANST